MLALTTFNRACSDCSMSFCEQVTTVNRSAEQAHREESEIKRLATNGIP